MIDNAQDRRLKQLLNLGPDKADDVIELSDVTVGTTREDEEIIELTEEVVDEVMGAVSRTAGYQNEGQVLDLSEAEGFPRQNGFTADLDGNGVFVDSDTHGPLDLGEEEAEQLEDYITRELDHYFGIDEPAELRPPEAEAEKVPVDISPDESALLSISQEALDAAVERVIEKKFAARIEKLISERIDSRVKEHMDRLKEDLLVAGGK